jgi:hypothetical protein
MYPAGKFNDLELGLPLTAPIEPKGESGALANRVRQVAGSVRRLGSAFRADPETLVIERERIEGELLSIARQIDREA